jgi:prolyl-tRNA synthetase
VKEADVVDAVEKMLEEIQHNLYAKARVDLESNIATVQSYQQFQETLKAKGGFIRAAWCGKATCEAKVKDDTGATIRLRPFEKETATSPCIACGEKAEEMVYFARSY